MSEKNNILDNLASMAKGLSTGSDRLELLYPRSRECVEALIAVSPDQYSASDVARAVEDTDCHLVNLNLTAARTVQGKLVVALRVDSVTADALVSSLSRYGYEVLAVSGGTPWVDDEESRRRVAELLHIMEI